MMHISAKRTVLTSFLVNGLDIVLNATMMLVTGSVVLVAGALEGFSDLLATGLLLIGLGISKRRPNKSHPFGYGKALFSWTLISAIVMLIFGAGLSFYFGLKRFISPEEIQYIGLAYLTLCIAISTNGYALSVSARRLFYEQPLKKIKHIFFNTNHVETKNTFILDFTGTCAALIGLIALIIYQSSGIRQFDGIGGMLMGLVIAFSSIFLIWGVKDFLSGKGASPEIIDNITNIVLQFDQVKSVVEENSMYLGSEKLLLHLDIEVNKSLTASEIDLLVDEIKESIKKAVPLISNIQIETITN